MNQLPYKKLLVTSLLVVIGLSLATPLITNAVSFSLIDPDQCSGTLTFPPGAKYCTLCDGLKVVQRGMNYLFDLGLAVAVLMITYGGIMIAVAGASPSKVGEGRKIITGAVVGFAIMLVAWLIINEVFYLFVTNNVTGKPWNEITCPPAETLGAIGGPPAPIGTGGGGEGGGPPAPPGGGACSCDTNGCSCPNCGDSPGVARILACVQSKGLPLGSIYTYNGAHSSCNSKHFGLTCAVKGSHAIDFGNQTKYLEIFAAVGQCAQQSGDSAGCRCETNGPPVVIVPCTNPSAGHIHCDVNIGGC